MNGWLAQGHLASLHGTERIQTWDSQTVAQPSNYYTRLVHWSSLALLVDKENPNCNPQPADMHCLDIPTVL